MERRDEEDDGRLERALVLEVDDGDTVRAAGRVLLNVGSGEEC